MIRSVLTSLVVIVVLGLFFLPLLFNGLVNSYIVESKNQIQKSNQQTSLYQRVERTTIIFGGDVMLGRSVMIASQKVGDFRYPFVFIASILSDADLAVVNLENPIIADCPSHNSGYKFCSPIESVAGLEYAGVDVVSLVNNHMGNFGIEGFQQTKSLLNEMGISFIEADKLTVKRVNDVNIGFLGFDFTVNEPVDMDYQLIEESSPIVDILVVFLHWGVEYTSQPIQAERDWAEKMVESGADVVVGSHPHWVQETDHIGKVPVYYSLGNLIFDQMWSEETKKGILVKLVFEKEQLTNEVVYPIYIDKIGQPLITSDSNN